MQLSHLQIRDFRNLVDVEMEPSASVNLVYGQNASGKTSLLEAIYYLSHLRSFRTPNVSDLIRRNASRLSLFSKAIDSYGHQIPIGISRSKDALEVRANHQAIHRVADLTALLPVQAIHPDSYRLIAGSPAERRAYLDWGVFHVEQGFFEAWRRFRKALSQRNAALKSGGRASLCKLWDNELNKSAAHIDTLRRSYVVELLVCLKPLLEKFYPGQEVTIEYRRGWKQDRELTEVLAESFERDRARGFTHHGPHRADIDIHVDGKSAQTGISRGQQKTLVALLKLAQIEQYTRSSARHCILLYDDLAAELDRQRRKLILELLRRMPVQLFLTAIEAEHLDLQGWSELRMFHVEHGQLA